MPKSNADEILQRNVVGLTENSRGQIIRVWFYGNEQFYLDVKAKTIKAKYSSAEYLGISANAVKKAVRKAKEWRGACSSE